MSSLALASLLSGADEVRALRAHYPVPRGQIAAGIEGLAAKAHGRASTVLLCSHFERYIYSVNEEAIEWLNGQECSLSQFPAGLLLQHSKIAIDELAKRDWQNREDSLRNFVASDGALWGDGGTTGTLEHGRLLVWMKAPNPKSIKRFYRLYGIDDILRAVTRKATSRGALHLDLKELVEKRNNIAHGDAQTEALPTDVTRYLYSVSKFCRSADQVLSRALQVVAGDRNRPW